MNVGDVAAIVEHIAAIRDDPEVAHAREDELWTEVLGAIALADTDDPAGIAAAALKSNDLDFPRWCA